MSDQVLEYRLSQAEMKISELTTVVEAQNKRIQALKEDEDRRERSQLVWGISALGAVVLTLGSVIWSYRGLIFK